MLGKLLYGFDKFYKTKLRVQTTGVKALLLTTSQEVILVKHSYIPGWHLPGGRIDPQESASVAAAREAKEEAGALIEPESLLLHGVYSNFGLGRNDHVIVLSGKGVTFDPQLRKRNFEIIDVRSFSLEALPRDISAATLKRIEEFQEGKGGLLGVWETAA